MILVLLLLAATLGSCGVSYLTQAMAGHFRIMNARHPIAKILKNDTLSPATRSKLKLVLEIHDFAVRELGLPNNKSYTVYSRIRGKYPGWNVYCTHKFSVEPKTWCFPVVGCVVYHGYFKYGKALAFAEKMKKQDLDVYVSPFTAYSTLGYYHDPILSTHLQYDSLYLAGLIFHELAHQRFYRSGDSRYSEGFAVTVERAGVLRWLRSLHREDQVVQAVKEWEESDRRVDRMLRARNELGDLYGSGRDTAFLLKQKDSILNSLELDLKITNRRMNNAWLVPVDTYHSLLPLFQSMLDSCGGNLPAFYKAAKERHL